MVGRMRLGNRGSRRCCLCVRSSQVNIVHACKLRLFKMGYCMNR